MTNLISSQLHTLATFGLHTLATFGLHTLATFGQVLLAELHMRLLRTLLSDVEKLRDTSQNPAKMDIGLLLQQVRPK